MTSPPAAGEDRAVLAIDQGTTSSRVIIFSRSGAILGSASKEHTNYFPRDGWVEHDAEEIWQAVLHCIAGALAAARLPPSAVASVGITNQRETVVVWDAASGAPLHRALVWQDLRGAPLCAALAAASPLGADRLRAVTGLPLVPYFTASKLAWLLDSVPGLRAAGEAGAALAGTVDAWLLWKLTGGAVHATDATNAARTMLFDITASRWDAELCALFGVPLALLPEVRDCAAAFGTTEPGLLGTSIPIRGIAGDQQAATIGQACFEPGMMKSTYGTGCFALLNSGTTPVASKNKVLTTIA
jgi:glycerol kinase